jgi:endonuclease/exonuclease/phosphatase family metal-dependent hydrolase
MRVLTYNIHHWEGTDGRVDVARVAAVVRASGADVAALNEVYHPASAPDLDRPALTAMADMLGMHAVFGAAQPMAWPGSAQPVGYGNACLSRHPIQAYATHRLPAPPGHEARGLLEVRVALADGRALTVYITHLDHLSEQVRLTQVQAALQWTARDRARPHLWMGDFNALAPDLPSPSPLLPPSSPNFGRGRGEGGDGEGLDPPSALEPSRLSVPAGASGEGQVIARLLRAGYVDCAAQAGSRQPTWSTTHPHQRIDYIFASAALAPSLRACWRWEEPPAAEASDHFAVVAEFAIA